MIKHIKKALRIPYHQFYLGESMTKIKTKKRMKELLQSRKFTEEIYKVRTNHKLNKTYIFRRALNE